MKKFLKNKSAYIVTFVILTLMFSVLFYIKDIFPFGDKSIIYGDMQDQIAAFYYHLYDSILGDKSILINFTTSGGINFFGILSYYILSPFSLIILLFERDKIYLVVSIITALKIITAGLTCLYSIRYFYKEKIGYLLSVALSILYALSGYTLLLYLITPWMDLVYLFPLIAVGLKKVLDLEKPYFYIIFLTIGITCSFYVSYIMLIFIFFISFMYVLTFVEKEKRKKSITALGVSTIISMLLSSIITIPSLMQIASSSRFGYQLGSVFFSKLGPITDKLEFFALTPMLIAPTILLLINFKNNKQFLKFYLPSLTILCLPYIIEPINKIVHFMSYACFPNRYGFITFYLLLIGACHYFSNRQNKNIKIQFKKIISTIITYLIIISVIFITNKIYLDVQKSMFELTIANYQNAFLTLIISCLITIIGALIISIINKSNNKFYQTLILILSIFTTYTNLYLCMGLTSYYDVNLTPYKVGSEISNKHQKDDYYKTKVNTTSMMTNNGMVTNFSSIDHFTSLTDENNSHTLKLLGYTSYWTRTSSRGGTIFTDILLGNKYYVTKGDFNSKLYSKKYDFSGNYKMYELNYDISYGYFTKNTSLLDKNNTFEIQNEIYKSITKKNDNIFDIYDKFNMENIKITKNEEYDKYEVIDKKSQNHLETDIEIKDNRTVYINIFKNLNNKQDISIYQSINVYINDELYLNKYPTKTTNGTVNLGTYENETINIKIEFIKDIDIKYIGIGTISNNKLIEFINNQKVNSNTKFNKNKIEIELDVKEDGIYFIPIAAIDGYKAKLNGEKTEIIKVFDNYLGIEVNKGNNKIEFTYIPPGLKIGIIVTLITLLITIFIFKFNIYAKLLENEIFTKIIYMLYKIIYIITIILIIILPIITFIYSYVK